MSSSDGLARRGALALLLLAGGCGFRPLYAPDERGGALWGQVRLEGVEGREGYHFRQALRRRLGEPAADADYTLTVSLSFDERGIAITPTDDITRIDVLGEARYALTPAGAEAPAMQGVARSVSAYNTLANPYATRVAADDAVRRVAEDLATRVFLRIAAEDGAA
jgi:LPS-assembly lipoprotein